MRCLLVSIGLGWMRSELLALAMLAACESPAPMATPSAKPVEAAQLGAPHGGVIRRIAVTDRADAAVSLDSLGGVRVWPTLDGTREPVSIAMTDARGIAIAADGSELLVAILDGSGSARMFRVTRTGVLRGSVQIAGDVPIEQLVGIEGGVLVARRDRAIERYDPSGLHGRITLDPGEELGALTARHGGAAVLVGPHAALPTVDDAPDDEDDFRQIRIARAPTTTTAEALRWIDLAHGLAWGGRVRVPVNMRLDRLAISPNHQRFAVVASTDLVLHVLDSETLAPVAGKDLGAREATTNPSFGFVDDDHVARVSTKVEWWVAASADPLTKDPVKAYAEQPESAANESGAVGDGILVWGRGSVLALQSPLETRYLGWRDPAIGHLVANVGGSLGLSRGSRLLLLDRTLHRTSEAALGERDGALDPVTWLDANHAVVQRRQLDAHGRIQIRSLELVDLRHRARTVPLVQARFFQRVEWDADLHLLGVVADGALRRFSTDLETTHATELPAIHTTGQVDAFRMLDPKRANGMAVVLAQSDPVTGGLVGFWTEGDGKTELAGMRGTALLGSVGGIGPTGAIYVKFEQTSLVVRGALAKPVEFHVQLGTVAADATGERLVAVQGSRVTMLDPEGTPRWSANVWDAQRALFSPDGARVVVETRGGLVALDAATGERASTACAYDFGIMTKPPEINALSAAPVCEASGT